MVEFLKDIKDIKIVFEDDCLAVISKPSGLPVHKSSGEQRYATLVDYLIEIFGRENLADIDGSDERPGIVHRLDADTSGLLIVAKRDDAAQKLTEMMKNHEVDRRYLALVHGICKFNSAKIDAPLLRHKTKRTTFIVADSPKARNATTLVYMLRRYSSLQVDNGYSLIECKLLTGRTHQIRVHMQYIKHPIVGDGVYSSFAPKDKQVSLGLTHQFLHSSKLKFTHPITGKILEFSDHLPSDLVCSLQKIENRLVDETEEFKQFERLVS